MEKKRLQRISNWLEYSKFGGFKAAGEINLVEKGSGIRFQDSRFYYFNSGGNTLFHLGIHRYNHLKPLRRSGFSFRLDLFYTDFNHRSDLFVAFRPEYRLAISRKLSLALFIRGGIDKNLGDSENPLIAETGLSLGFETRSPLDRTRLELGITFIGYREIQQLQARRWSGE